MSFLLEKETPDVLWLDIGQPEYFIRSFSFPFFCGDGTLGDIYQGNMNASTTQNNYFRLQTCTRR